MIRTTLAVIALLSASPGIAGGGFGGNPPALQDPDELLSMNRDTVMLNGKAAKPLLIDLQSKTMRFESIETKTIIDVSVGTDSLQ